MENGEMVAVCLDCFESLRGQFIEAGKYGIPVEKRQYNWMQIPPPPENEASQLITAQERLAKFTRPTVAPLASSNTAKTTTTSNNEQQPPNVSSSSVTTVVPRLKS